MVIYAKPRSLCFEYGVLRLDAALDFNAFHATDSFKTFEMESGVKPPHSKNQRLSVLLGPRSHPRHQPASASHLRHHLLELAHFLHHLLHLVKLVQHAVEFRHSHTAAGGDPLAALGIQDLRIFALEMRHRANHPFHLAKLLFLLAHVGTLHHLGTAREHADNFVERPKLFHLAQLLQKIFQRELAFAHFFFHALGLVHVQLLRRFLDQTHHVAHAQDARSHAFGMKGFEVLELLANAGELDRLVHHRLEAQRRPTPRVAVQPGEDGPRD